MLPNEPETLELKEIENPFLALTKAQAEVEKIRIQLQVRQSHLKLNGQIDPITDKVLEKAVDFEGFVDDLMADNVKIHPAYPWFSRVKGVGKENIGKVIGYVDIRKADTASSLWKYAGYHTVDGKAPKRTPGQKLDYNSRLRSMCWRLAGSLLKAGGKYYEYYVQEKTKYLSRFKAQGIKVVPASELPTENRKKRETADTISEGHVHNMALRKMIKLFLSNLWQAWREAEGLPTRNPYVLEYFPEHTHKIDAWEMVDREAKAAKVKKVRKQAS